MNTIVRLVFCCFAVLFSGCCYKLSGISIDPGIKTFFVQNFEAQAANAPPTLAVEFTERLKDKVRAESPLSLKNEGADIEFTGRVTDFRVVPLAPKPGEVVALNQLIVVVSVRFVNNVDEKKSWASERTFRHFAEFQNDVDLLSVQDRLLQQTIYPQLLDDIFNAAFNDW